MKIVIIYGIIAGVVGTCIGGVISAILGKKNNIVGVLFSIAAGVMLAMVCFDLLPESLKFANLFTVVISICAGALIVILLDVVIKIKKPHKNCKESDIECKKNNMAKVGILMLFAIALHNLPEGLIIGSSEVTDNGLLMTILIGFHNIPEGIAVAAPLIASGMNKGKAILLTAATGIPTLIGAILGYYIGIQSDVFAAISLGIASGAMLCIIFSEMIPEANKMNDSKTIGYTLFASFLFGMILIVALV